MQYRPFVTAPEQWLGACGEPTSEGRPKDRHDQAGTGTDEAFTCHQPGQYADPDRHSPENTPCEHVGVIFIPKG
jgi:hypothetical protein